MILNIVKNGTDSSSILECVRKTFNNSKVSIKTDYEISVDIEVVGEGGLHSLEGLKNWKIILETMTSGFGNFKWSRNERRTDNTANY